MIRNRIPNKFKAESMLKSAEIEMNYIKNLNPVKEAGATIISRIYEDFRMLGDALLLIRGKEAIGPDHHTEMINELFTLNVKTERPIRILNNLKKIRNNINYQGYIPLDEDVKEVISIAETCFEPLLKEVKKEVSKLNHKI